ncbi:MAG: hypothetical protein ACOYZ6_16795 [Chloroflexota bacterium]
MNTSRALFHILRADFLERVRSYGFLGLLLFSVFITYLFIPETSDIQIAGLQLGGYRAIYNSAWIGTMTTLLMGEFFLLFSFYLLKGSVERDRRTGVGQIIAATPITKIKYTLGKWLGNVAIASTMTLAIIVASALLQFLRAEDTHINLWQLASPFLIVLFPALTVIAATAVLFDCIPLLRGGIGNVLFFFIAYPLLALSLDLQGNTLLYPSIYQACAAQFDNCNPTRQIDAGLPPPADYPAFTYDGVTWLPSILLSRLAILFVGALIALLAAWFFHRFDPAKADISFMRIPSIKRTPTPQTESSAQTLTLPRQPTHLTPLAPASRPSAFSWLMRLFVAELRLTFKGTRWLWYLFAFGIFIAQAITPLDIAQLYILPLAFILPLTFWSNLGVREVKHRTEQLVLSAPHPLTRQLPITWFTGVIIAFFITSPTVFHLLLDGQWSAFGGLFSGILFVPSLAMALGVWTNGSKLFEGGYLFFWYLASMYSIPAFDFMGRVPLAYQQGIPLAYFLLTILLVVIAYFGRQRQAIK